MIKSQPRLDALSEAAAQMFLEQGYEAMSVDALIVQVGGSKRNVYNHFGGKEGLFIKSVTDLCAKINEPVVELQIENCEPVKALTCFSKTILKVMLHPRTLSMHRLMVASSARFPNLSEKIWQSGPDVAIRILDKWIQLQQKKGVLNKNRNSRKMAYQYISMLTGNLQLRTLVSSKKKALTKKETEDFVDETVESFFYGNAQKSKSEKSK